MIYSMTGYAVAAAESPVGALHLELRSVNHRYLDVQFRIPDDLRTLEAGLREKTTGRITRGKVEVRITLNKTPTSQSGLQINETLLAQLKQLNDEVMAAIPESAPLTVNDVLRWPGILGNDTLQLEDLQEECGQLLERALHELTATR